MTDLTIHRYNVSFEPTEICSGGSFIGLAIAQEEGPLARGTMFFLEPKEGLTPEETARLAALLSEDTAHFGVVTGATDAP